MPLGHLKQNSFTFNPTEGYLVLLISRNAAQLEECKCQRISKLFSRLLDERFPTCSVATDFVHRQSDTPGSTLSFFKFKLARYIKLRPLFKSQTSNRLTRVCLPNSCMEWLGREQLSESLNTTKNTRT